MWKRQQGDFSIHVVDHFVRKGDVVLDIGASWGLYTCRLAQLVGHQGQVHVFEPNAANAASLKAIRGGRSNITIYPVALSDHQGEAELHIPVVGGYRINALASLSVPSAHSAVAYDISSVRMEPLDAILPTDGRPVAFVKCDVEGHELAVVRGAEETLRRAHPVLLIEIEQRHQNTDIRDIFTFLAGLGYTGYSLHEDGLRPLAVFDLHRDQLAFLGTDFVLYEMPRGYVHDFLFVPQGTDVARLLASRSS